MLIGEDLDMSDETKKLLKITFEYEDKIRYLEGNEAQEWLKTMDAFCVMEFIHGREFPNFKWNVIKK